MYGGLWGYWSAFLTARRERAIENCQLWVGMENQKCTDHDARHMAGKQQTGMVPEIEVPG
jgi:hypothetical protein